MIDKGAIIFTGRGAICLWGTRSFWGGQRGGGDQFFSVGQKGVPEFFEGQRWGEQNFFSFFYYIKMLVLP